MDVPAAKRGGLFDAGGMIPLRVDDVQPRIFLTINFTIVLAVVLVTGLIGITAVLYLALVPTDLGRLMIDSLVHTLTIGRKGEPAISGACMADLDDIFDVAGDEWIQYGVLKPATDENTSGHMGIALMDANEVPLGKPEKGRWYGGLS